MKDDRIYRIPTKRMSGIFAMVFGCVVALLIPSQISIKGQTGITSQTIPYFLAGVIFLLGAWLTFTSVVLKKEDYKEVCVPLEVRRIVFLLALVAYVFLMDWIGFLLSSLLIGSFVLWYMEDRKPLHYAIVGICVVVIYLVFRFLLDVNFISAWGV